VTKISVIIPVYKVEKYLPQCLDSVLAQTFSDFEALCVDDGSPDRCGEILAKYAQKDNRIKVIAQENQGVSAARNRAMKEAKGEYIAFLDADDMLAPSFLEKMSFVLEQDSEAQMSWCNFIKDSDEPNFEQNPRSEAPKLCNRPFEHYFLRAKPRMESSVWAKMFKKQVLDGLEFPQDQAYGEDLVVLYQAMYRMPKAVFVPEDLFFYRVRPESAMHVGLTSRRMDSELAMSEKVERIFAGKEMTPGVRKAFDLFVSRRFFNMVFRLPKAKDPMNYKKWRKAYLPILVRFEREGIFNPRRLCFRKRIQYWWMKRN
jgi:glycosyltransferase involved in cell wall biosynthesis